MIGYGFRRSNRANLTLIAAIAAVIPTAQASAATDGSLGATSTGTVGITASVSTRAKITGLTNVSFVGQDPATAASSAQSICVWSNTATKAYSITASGSGTGSAFTLTNGSATVPYLVEWAASSGATSGSALSAGSASGSLTSTATNQNCASGPTASASLIVKMTTNDLGTMVGGSSYTGTLTLLVSPL